MVVVVSQQNSLIEDIKKNGVRFFSRKANIKLGTNLALEGTSDFPTGLIPGVKIKQMGNNEASATLKGVSGIAAINNSNHVPIINPGVGS